MYKTTALTINRTSNCIVSKLHTNGAVTIGSIPVGGIELIANKFYAFDILFLGLLVVSQAMIDFFCKYT